MAWIEGLEATLVLWLLALIALLVLIPGAWRLHTWQPGLRYRADRRNGDRFKPLFRLRVFKRHTHAYVGQVRDIHQGGMRMHAVGPMSDSESLELEISALPSGDSANLIPVRARKVWQETGGGDGSVEIGFRFTRLSRTARQAIVALSPLSTATSKAQHPDTRGA